MPPPSPFTNRGQLSTPIGGQIWTPTDNPSSSIRAFGTPPALESSVPPPPLWRERAMSIPAD